MRIFNDSSSVTQASTVHLGWNGEEQIYVPFKNIIPILSPSDLIIDGWDINSANLYEACQRARVSSEYSRKEKNLEIGFTRPIQTTQLKHDPPFVLVHFMRSS